MDLHFEFTLTTSKVCEVSLGDPVLTITVAPLLSSVHCDDVLGDVIDDDYPPVGVARLGE
jgi:hypothetical protein